MKKIFKGMRIVSQMLGFDPLTFVNFFRGLPLYIKEFLLLKRQNIEQDFPFGRFMPILNDRFEQSGSIGTHYFHQDLHVARKILKANPVRHIDIGSRIDGFVSHLATFRTVEVLDIRPLTNVDSNILFKQADLMKLPTELINQCESVSSLHAIEHFGLGRYSDPIDAHGHIKAIDNIHAMLKSGGKFYFSVPIGPQRIEFNAHRVFSIGYLLKLFEGKFMLDKFAYVNDENKLIDVIDLNKDLIDNNCYCEWGCGIFELSCIK